jgi:hypothetical protein
VPVNDVGRERGVTLEPFFGGSLCPCQTNDPIVHRKWAWSQPERGCRGVGGAPIDSPYAGEAEGVLRGAGQRRGAPGGRWKE